MAFTFSKYFRTAGFRAAKFFGGQITGGPSVCGGSDNRRLSRNVLSGDHDAWNVLVFRLSCLGNGLLLSSRLIGGRWRLSGDRPFRADQSQNRANFDRLAFVHVDCEQGPGGG